MRMYTRCEAWEKEMLFERVTRRGGEATPKVERGGRQGMGSWEESRWAGHVLLMFQMRQIGKVEVFPLLLRNTFCTLSTI